MLLAHTHEASSAVTMHHTVATKTATMITNNLRTPTPFSAPPHPQSFEAARCLGPLSGAGRAIP
ncbi:hypothetical protein GCM10009603_35530 [Nocardiopsis exhalans]